MKRPTPSRRRRKYGPGAFYGDDEMRQINARNEISHSVERKAIHKLKQMFNSQECIIIYGNSKLRKIYIRYGSPMGIVGLIMSACARRNIILKLFIRRFRYCLRDALYMRHKSFFLFRNRNSAFVNAVYCSPSYYSNISKMKSRIYRWLFYYLKSTKYNKYGNSL